MKRKRKHRTHGIRILTVSDIESKELKQQVADKTLPPVDLVLSCGDMAPEYLSYIRERIDSPLFYVKGNHDIRYTPNNPMGCMNIHGRIIQFKTLNILGLEGSMWYNGGPNQYTDKQMRKIILGQWFSIWRKGGIDMVITHAAPRHIKDAEDRCHIGFESFIKLLNTYEPAYFIHGHIHREFQSGEERVTKCGSTRVINTCGYNIIEV
ncbi:MAG: Icc-like protein [Desulfobacteraceae bacterium]|nr:MAG: Icc-like protein [Desulfobacteraceae bacterium]